MTPALMLTEISTGDQPQAEPPGRKTDSDRTIDPGDFQRLGLFMAGVSQYLVNPRFGIAEFASGWTYWGLFAAINIGILTAGSWWSFRRLVGPPVRQGDD